MFIGLIESLKCFFKVIIRKLKQKPQNLMKEGTKRERESKKRDLLLVPGRIVVANASNIADIHAILVVD